MCRPLEASLLFQAACTCLQRLRLDESLQQAACRAALHAAAGALPGELAGGAATDAVLQGVMEAARHFVSAAA